MIKDCAGGAAAVTALLLFSILVLFLPKLSQHSLCLYYRTSRRTDSESEMLTLHMTV